ncbi:hypothetical protein BDV96DRAFT_589010 [Lophiotrema nucula]|uniref:F-box domain-containing protein n=1 Tax=Lophiotrema nucula TaxID=690887 RepID=A0A6A5YJZ8_9PLEO|nr:hypothetical protein BDV96DRAFT_589010 [Lophiotrema nucula]
MKVLEGCFGWRPSKMPSAERKHTLVWLWILKWVMIVPVAIAAFKAKSTYNFVRNHEELQRSPPYDNNVLLSQLLVYVGIMPIFPWIFISSVLLIYLKGPWLFLVGIVDLGLAVTTAIGAGMEAKYLPASYDGCKPAKAEAWQVHGDYKSFFVQAAELQGKKSPQGACKDFVTAWTLAAGVVFFQMLAAYIGIFSDESEYSILNPFRPLFNLILIIFGPPFWFHVHVSPRIRFTYRYIIKFFRRVGSQRKPHFVKSAPYTPKYEEGIHISNPKLQEVLVIEHVLLNVVDYLHYEDVIHFSLTSKAVREAVFPGRDLLHRLPKLQKRCCETDTKKKCLYCNKHICTGCQVERQLSGLSGTRHVTTCQPYCRGCYYQQFSRHQRGYKKPCKCYTTDRELCFLGICRTCNLRDFNEMQETRQKRYEQQARDKAEGKFLAPNENVKCGNCKQDLKSGTRWWVCGKCKGECRDKMHPPYVGKKRLSDVEMAETHNEKVEELESSRWKWSTIFGVR